MSLTLYFHPLASYCWSIIIELLADHHPGATLLVPRDADAARDARAQD